MCNLYSNQVQEYQCVSARFSSLEEAFRFIRTFPAKDFVDLYSENMSCSDCPSYAVRVYIVRYFTWCSVKTDDEKKSGI